MKLREYREEDCRELARLFYDTVHTVNGADYTGKQLDAWAPEGIDLASWNQSFLEHHTVVAVRDGIIAGFGDMEDGGYLDRLYVHREHQGKGVGSAICDRLERKARGKVVVHASITARPFFERRGYRVVKAQQVERRGVALVNFIMEKDTGCVVRKMRKDEIQLLDDFLYEAIFVPEGTDPPPRDIVEKPELRIYTEGFGGSAHDRALVAETDGRVVGVIWSRIMDDYGHIDDGTPSMAMAVKDGHRGRGTGTALLDEMLRTLRKAGYPMVSLSVQKENYAAAMYLKAGFKILDETDEEYIMVAHL